MKGNFHWGNGEHKANNCKVAKDVKCRMCSAQGHIQSACDQGKAQSEEENGGGKDSLALEYQQPQVTEYSQVNVAQVALAQSPGNNS